MAGKVFTQDQVAAHNSASDLWITIDGIVFDVTGFQQDHPGGQKILQRVAGKDASKQFWKYHNEAILNKYKPKLAVGAIEGSAAAEAAGAGSGAGPSPDTNTDADVGEETYYGELLPYADPQWYQGYANPYYNESHHALRREVRRLVEREILPYVHEWDEAYEVPESVYKTFGKHGYLAAAIGVHPFPADYCEYRIKALPPGQEMDAFHEFIVVDELARCGSGGVVWNLLGGLSIGAAPVFKHASEELKRRVIPPILNGDKRICLCITEPAAGSDVANLQTTARKTPDGRHYIVNGEKKWITNGIMSDYFTVAVRTGGPGMAGISMLLIERDMPGLKTRHMKCMGVWASGTTYVTFEDVKVPVENLLGEENKGFKTIMTNFNHERMGIAMQANRFARVCYEESLKYAHKRETFGKKLIDHDIICYKLAQMARQIEATHAWIETLVYQMQQLDETECMLRMGGAVAGCKAQAGIVYNFCAQEALQIFGGLGYTRGGQGDKIERLYRDVRAYTVPGGSEEIMLLLSMNQGLKVAKALGAKL